MGTNRIAGFFRAVRSAGPALVACRVAREPLYVSWGRGMTIPVGSPIKISRQDYSELHRHGLVEPIDEGRHPWRP